MAKKGHRRVPGAFPQTGRLPAGVASRQSLARRAADMRAQAEEHRAALAERTFVGTAGGGVVTVVVRGTGEVASVRFEPGALDAADPEMAGDLVVAAVNLALRQAQEAAAASVGLDLGGLDSAALGIEDLRGLLG